MDNVLNKLPYLIMWWLVWKGLGGVATLEEMCIWGLSLKFQFAVTMPSSLLMPPACGTSWKLSAPAPEPCVLTAAIFPATTVMDSPSNTLISKETLYFCKLL